MSTPVVVVGIGADGWDGLSPRARRAVEDADVLRGSARQLALVPDDVPAERVPWPSPMAPALAGLFDRRDEWEGRRDTARSFVERERNWHANVANYAPVYERQIGKAA